MAVPLESPLIGVVVPVFGHSRLVGEALVSVLDQTFDGSIAVVVVVDGDPAPETTLTVRSLASAGDRPVYTLFRRNGRLPAARNAGIDMLLQLHPDLDAIYFLDADNRLSPHSLAVFWRCLADNPGAAWAYPDIGFVGLTWGAAGIDFRQTAPVYDPMRHLMGNICEAGSMVRGDVFRAGVRFDETFTDGYEDWEFWLQCLDRGLVGIPAAGAGFQYRRRSDSMLADADRTSSAIKARLFSKHRRIFSPENVTEKFLHACATYLLADKNGEWRLLSADGSWFRQGSVSLDALIETAREHFHFAYLPRFALLPIGNHDHQPAVSIERTIALLADRPRRLRTTIDLELAAPGSVDLGFDVIALDELETQSDRRLADLARRLGRIDEPLAHRMDRRYAGPASFQIDQFVRDRLAAEVDRPMPVSTIQTPSGPVGTRPPLLIDSAGRWPTHPFRPALEARLSGLGEAELHTDEPTVGWTRYAGRVFPYYESTYALSSRTEGDRAEFAMIVADSRALFYAGELKRIAKKVLFVTPYPTLEQDFAAIEAAEHALFEVFCTPQTAARLRSIGVPQRKIVDLSGDGTNSNMVAQ